jgi:hypothetical protein
MEKNCELVKAELLDLMKILEPLRSTSLDESSRVLFEDFDKICLILQEWDDVVYSFASEMKYAATKVELADRGQG